jgi:catechol 2,3-dioxygenase-like lactoylglutathione lyase family enzyme
MPVSFLAITLHVASVWKTVSWYEEMFGLHPHFLAPDGSYAELATPGAVLAFSSNELEAHLLPSFRRNTLLDEQPPGLHLTFAAPDLGAIYAKALQQGASAVHQPVRRPWGRLEACVRDPNGILLTLVADADLDGVESKQLAYWPS